MKIKLTPQRRADHLALEVSGDTLIINGEAFDFSPLAEGATLPREAVACDWLASGVAREAGEICLTLILPYGPGAPAETIDPAPIAAGDGPVALPPYDASEVSQ